jgi:hypothetical protein
MGPKRREKLDHLIDTLAADFNLLAADFNQMLKTIRSHLSGGDSNLEAPTEEATVAGNVGRQVVYTDGHGEHVGWVVDYEAGRDKGDHLISGWENAAGRAAKQGDTFTAWSVMRVKPENGTFRFV